MAWETVIGLEIHAQLNTQSKLFSAASTRFGAVPNSQASYIDAGLPGVLPVLNKAAITKAIRFGLAINADINDCSYFERKNYFYPDLPKGYQISQYQKPIVSGGSLDFELPDGHVRTLEFIRAHLEEDAGKSIHDVDPHYTGIDLNRAGNPLLEIVTLPCLHSAKEAVSALKAIHQLVRFLDICDGNMDEGSFRCDVNISLRRQNSQQLGIRTELKNLNSFRFIEQAIHYEQDRQQQLLETGQQVVQETRLFSPQSQSTHVMRGKEQEQDYRYFPDPDLLPIPIDETLIKQIHREMPRLPQEIKEHLQQQEQFIKEDIDFLLAHPANSHYYFTIRQISKADGKTIVNWLKGPYSALLNEQQRTFANPPVSAEELAQLLDAVHNKSLTHALARKIFTKAATKQQSIVSLIQSTRQNQQRDDVINEMLIELLESHPQQVKQLCEGKDKLQGFFVGQLMKACKGQANPAQIQQLIKKYIAEKKSK